MSVTTKMNVDVSGFKKGMAEAQASVRTMDAALKKNEASYKAAGNAEEYMAKKSDLLKQKLNSQQAAAKAAEQALVAMGKNGVDPASTQYQKMAQSLLQAQTAALETQAELQGLDSAQKQAASSADELTKSVNGIGKKISLDQVINGISKITNGLENAAKKAVRIGQEIWNNIIDTAAWSDDVGTLAERLGLTTTQVQQMQAVAAEFEAPVETMAKTWKKVKMNMTSDSDDVIAAFKEVGVVVTQTVDTGFGKVEQTQMISNDYLDIFWQTGEAIMRMTDAAKQERLAQTLLGRSWDELAPLFNKGRKAYEEAMEGASYASEEAIQNNAALADSVSALQHNFDVFKAEVLGQIAPEIQKVTDTFGGLLHEITEYAKSPEGQEMLSKIGEAIGDLVEDIANIDPEAVVSGFVSVITTLQSGLQWIIDNKTKVVNALKGIVMGWGLLKLTGGALQVMKLIEGLQGLGLGNTQTTGTDTGSTGNGTGGSKPIVTGNGDVNVNTDVVNFDDMGGAGMGFAFGLGYDIMMKDLETNRSWDALFEKYGFNMNDPDVYRAVWEGIAGKPGSAEQMAYIKEARAHGYSGITNDYIPENIDEILQGISVQLNPVLAPDAVGQIEREIRPIHIPAVVDVVGFSGAIPGLGGSGEMQNLMTEPGNSRPFRTHANGIWSVPYDGYLSVLHKNEQVVPAREVNSRSFSSNLYVENMNMGGGMDADALAAAIASRNRRLMAGYGS